MSTGEEKWKIVLYINNNIEEDIIVIKETNTYIVVKGREKRITGIYCTLALNKSEMRE